MTFEQMWHYGMLAFKNGIVMEQGQMSFEPGIVVLCVGVCMLIGYLIGRLNFGVIISRIYGQDIREKGSGNAGATNMMRVYGKKASILTLACDALKTIIAVLLARFLVFGYLGAYIAGISVILGHAWPVYFKFKGGKGVAAISAFCLVTEPWIFLIELVIFLIILFGFKMVSLGSVMIALIFPLMVFNFRGAGIHIILALIAAGLVVFLHRQNIVRIYNHTEHKFSFGKKKQPKSEPTSEELAEAPAQLEENQNEEDKK